MADVRPVSLLRLYVRVSRFIVRIDHQALKWILELKQCSDRLARWRLRLVKFDFKIQHRRERKHTAVDALSRLPTDQPDKSEFDDENPPYEASKVHTVKDNED